MKNGRLDSSGGISDRLHDLVSVIAFVVLLICAAFWGEALADHGLSAIDPDVAEIYDYENATFAAAACESLKGSSCNTVTSASWHPDHWNIRYWRDSTVTPAIRHSFGYPSGTCSDSERWDGSDPETGECLPPPECEADTFVFSGDFEGVTNGQTCYSGCITEVRGVAARFPKHDTESQRWTYGDWYETGETCGASIQPGDGNLSDQDGNVWTVDDTNINCGQFNGEDICAPAIPEGGKCVFDGSGGWSCANKGDQSVVPPHDRTTETVETTNSASVEWYDYSQSTSQTTITVSQGTITSGGDLSSGSPDPEAGGTGSGIEGSGDEEGEEPTFCEEAPDLCDTSAEVTDPGALPEEVIDVGNLRSDYTSPIASNADCPAPYTFDVMGSTHELPYTAMCDLAALVRPLVIAMAYLFGLFFAVRTLS